MFLGKETKFDIGDTVRVISGRRKGMTFVVQTIRLTIIEPERTDKDNIYPSTEYTGKIKGDIDGRFEEIFS